MYESETKYVLGAGEIELKSMLAEIEEAKMNISKYQADTARYETDARYSLGKAEVDVKLIGTNIEIIKSQIAAAMGVVDSIAKMAGTMAAGAASALNASASISTNDSTSCVASSSETVSHGTMVATNTNYDCEC